MSLRKHLSLVLALLLCLPFGRAQLDHYLQIKDLSVATPGPVSNLSIVDGRLYCYGAGMMLSADLFDGTPSQFEADVDMMHIDPEMDYVVRNPQNRHLYYTKRNAKGEGLLFECVETPGKKLQKKQVKFHGMKMGVMHPTFSPDGRKMVFVSASRDGVGSYDLWCSVRLGDKWGTPINMGKRINTQGDEVMPCMAGDFLLFAAKGRPDKFGGYNIFATRFLANRQVGDTVSMLPVGQNQVLEMPSPINNESDNYEMVVSPDGRWGLWLESTAEGQKFRKFTGSLMGVKLQGTIRDAQHPLDSAVVELIQHGQVIDRQATAKNGQFCFYVAPGQMFDLHFSRRNCFDQNLTLTSNRPSDDNLIVEINHNILLKSLPLNVPQVFTGIFGHGASVEVSRQGREQLRDIILFLRDNPHLKVEVVLWSDVMADAKFNSMLSEQRLVSVREYLEQELHKGMQVTYENGCLNGEGCFNGSGVSTLSILMSE